jgi:hypothetical protein
VSTSDQEPIDLRPGRSPLVTTTATTVTVELRVVGGEMRDGLFVPTPRTRLVIQCDQDGHIGVRIAESRTAGA